MSDKSVRQFGRYSVELSHLEKTIYPDDRISKADVIEYYGKIAEIMLPHLADRPLTLQRFPDGIGESGFYQKEAGDYFPDWITTVEIETEAGVKNQAICDKAATLVYLANQGCITPHIWSSTTDALKRPDRMIFDLDPPGDDFGPVRVVAKRLLALLDKLKTAAFLQLTGSRGLHIVIPLRPKHEFDRVRKLSQAIAKRLTERFPDEITVEQRKTKRGDRLFLDTTRNAYGQTYVCPYALRPLPGAPVATPIERDELDRSSLTAQDYTIANIHRRMARVSDPWHNIGRRQVSLETIEAKLESLD